MQLRAYWYDRRRGTAEKIGMFERKGKKDLTSPSMGKGKDWVLIDNVAKENPTPARGSK